MNILISGLEEGLWIQFGSYAYGPIICGFWKWAGKDLF
jgi:hypothetical protein